MWFFQACWVLITIAATITAQDDNCNPEWSKPAKIPKHKNPVWTILQNTLDEHNHVADESTLKSVHVVFRHGDRTPDPESLYPLDPYYNYTYYPESYGQLTNLGKKQEYNIGVALRQRYNQFLGDIYTPTIMQPQSTDYGRTKMSLQLALAGLWPPAEAQMWNKKLLWQPIPYSYQTGQTDQLLGDPYATCKRYRVLRDKYLNTEEYKTENEKLKPFYNYMQQHTGLNISNVEDIYNIFFTLFSEESMGLQLPEWTKCVWPDKITEVAIEFYTVMTKTPALLRLAHGNLMKKILHDASNSKNATSSDATKLFIYSAHERNVAFMLIALGIFKPHIPPYASYVTLEVHEINNVLGFKILYQDYEKKHPKLMKIPGCDTFCPYDQFYNIVRDQLPNELC